MTARTVIDVQPIVWTVIILGFFAVLAGFVVALDRVIRFEIERWRARRGRPS